MAQMEFYFNDSEIKELFQYITSKGGKFIPDLLYNSGQYIIVATYEQLKKIQQTETVHFFLIDDTFFIEPLLVTQNRYLKEHQYHINQRKGGPYIDFSFYRGYAKDAVIKYKASIMDVYPKFIHADSLEEFKATDELKQCYEDIVKYIKSKSKRITKNNKRYWIGHEVLKELSLPSPG